MRFFNAIPPPPRSFFNIAQSAEQNLAGFSQIISL